jgi:hypothetical protein
MTIIAHNRKLGTCAKRAWQFGHVPHRVSIVSWFKSVLLTLKYVWADFHKSTSICRYFSKNHLNWKTTKNCQKKPFLVVSRFEWFIEKYLQIEVDLWKSAKTHFEVNRTDLNQETIETRWGTCPNGHALFAHVPSFLFWPTMVVETFLTHQNNRNGNIYIKVMKQHML